MMIIILLLLALGPAQAQAQVSVATWASFDTIEADTMVVGNAVRDIEADYTGRPWFASARGLFYQVAADSVASISWGSTDYSQGSPNNVFALASGATDLYVGTARGLVVLDSADVTGADTVRYTVGDGLPDSTVMRLTIEDDQDTLWVGTPDGLALFDVTNSALDTTEIDSTSGRLIYSIAVDSTGGIWYGTNNGLDRQAYGYWFHYDTSNSDLADNLVHALAVDTSGNLWIGTDKGVQVFDMDTTFTLYTDDSLGVGPQVRALAHDPVDNIMWIGTLTGLAAYETGLPYPASAWRSYTAAGTSDSLDSDVIMAIMPDTAANKTWIGTGQSLRLLFESTKVP